MELDELIKEIQDLKEKERQLEYLKKDKKKMADPINLNKVNFTIGLEMINAYINTKADLIEKVSD